MNKVTASEACFWVCRGGPKGRCSVLVDLHNDEGLVRPKYDEPATFNIGRVTSLRSAIAHGRRKARAYAAKFGVKARDVSYDPDSTYDLSEPGDWHPNTQGVRH